MDIDRTGDQDRCSRTPAGRPARQRGGVSYGFLPLAKLVLFAAALLTMNNPQALALAARHAYIGADLVTDEEPRPGADYDAVEEPPEPLIVDDLRTEGVAVAFNESVTDAA